MFIYSIDTHLYKKKIIFFSKRWLEFDNAMHYFIVECIVLFSIFIGLISLYCLNQNHYKAEIHNYIYRCPCMHVSQDRAVCLFYNLDCYLNVLGTVL